MKLTETEPVKEWHNDKLKTRIFWLAIQVKNIAIHWIQRAATMLHVSGSETSHTACNFILNTQVKTQSLKLHVCTHPANFTLR